MSDALWISRVAEVIDEGDGAWRSCSGCHETNEGVPLGEYSAAFRAHVGCGCSECGGLGVVWDATDYADMGEWMSRSPSERFADWLNEGPVLAKEAGLYVGIKVSPAPLPTEGE